MREWNGKRLGEGELVERLREINKEVNRNAWKILKNRQQVSITHFVTFFIEKDKKDSQFKANYDLNAELKLFVNEHASKKTKIDEEASQHFTKEISSALMFENEVVSQLLSIFGAAVRDLVANGHTLSLNFDFCRIKISKQ
jgi:hypothetical protein